MTRDQWIAIASAPIAEFALDWANAVDATMHGHSVEHPDSDDVAARLYDTLVAPRQQPVPPTSSEAE